MLDASLDLIGRGEHEQAREILDRALGRTRTTVGELRDLSFNLEPVALRDHGFTAAVDALAQTRGRERRIEVTLDVALIDALAEQTQAALYQIVREALEEAIRRGPPSRFEVAATADVPGTLRLVIRDDAPTERRRRALEVMAERARTLGANLTLDHEVGGTTMSLELRGQPRGADWSPGGRRAPGRSNFFSSSGTPRARSWWSRPAKPRPSAPAWRSRASSFASRSSPRRRPPATAASARTSPASRLRST